MSDSVSFCDTSHKYLEIRKVYNELKDCTVVALAEVFNIPYEKAHRHLKLNLGRQNRKGLFEKEVKSLPGTFKEYRIAIRSFGCDNVPKITLGQFIKQHPIGRYYVLVRGHALAVIDGVVHDHSYKPRRVVRWAMRVHL